MYRRLYFKHLKVAQTPQVVQAPQVVQTPAVGTVSNYAGASMAFQVLYKSKVNSTLAFIQRSGK